MLKRLTISQTVEYLQQVSILLNDGYLLQDALQQVQLFQGKKTYRQTLAILNNCQHALSFAESLATYTKLEPFLIQILKDAEIKKELSDVLEKVVIYREKLLDDHLKTFSKFHQTLYYPLMIGFIAFFLTLSIMIYIIPTFSHLFANFGVELPILTQFLLNISEFIINNIYLILLIILSSVIILSKAKKNQSTWLYKRLSKNWLVGELYQQNIIIIFLRTAHLMFSLKRPINETFLAMQDLTDHYHAHLFKMFKEKRATTNNFSPYFSFLINQCLNSKHIEKHLVSITDRLTLQLQQQSEFTKKFSEFLLLIIIGCLIGLIVIAVYLPLFRFGSLF